MMKEKISIKPSSKGFSSTNTVYLKDTRDTKIKISAFHIPDKKNDGNIHHYTIDLSVWKRKIGTNDFEPFLSEDNDFPEATHKRIKITDKNAIKNLSSFLNSQNALIGSKIDTEVILTNKENYQEIESIKDKLSKLEISIDDLDSLNKIVKLKKIESGKLSLQKMLELIDEDPSNFLSNITKEPTTSSYQANQKEKVFQNWVENNLWVFGTSYIKKLEETSLSFTSDSDIVMETLDGFYELIELKLPIPDLFSYDSSHKTYYPSSKLSKAVAQTLKYLQDIAEYKHQIQNANNTKILFPKAKIIIGRSCISDDEKEALRRFNSSFNNIEIITYENMLNNAERLIGLYNQSA